MTRRGICGARARLCVNQQRKKREGVRGQGFIFGRCRSDDEEGVGRGVKAAARRAGHEAWRWSDGIYPVNCFLKKNAVLHWKKVWGAPPPPPPPPPRNRAARVQKRRQDSLGLGWGNHDTSHVRHTLLPGCILFDLMGIPARVSSTLPSSARTFITHAGNAGGGGGGRLGRAHPPPRFPSSRMSASSPVFADVDLLSDKETEVADFSRIRLVPAPRLGYALADCGSGC